LGANAVGDFLGYLKNSVQENQPKQEEWREEPPFFQALCDHQVVL
jgi:hypothetical protein